ncbi:hypothetical protein DXI23_03845 [Marinobacter flavimaris]|uniref:Uncharacterized protein n=1 Tax=Marinobacter flavimaris TaxID=262076 RepID=A0A3D8H934_9GAMM|nr:Tic22 family protein [Marinobacter flavimaris]PPI79394.1 hypothetical protein MDHKLMBL_14630 [Marinobacter flavimaris]RDU42806.1 hypothetical protein DXI23_03845 [Marinobacter flavimaris]
MRLLESPLKTLKKFFGRKQLAIRSLAALFVLLTCDVFAAETQNATKLKAIADKLNAVPVYFLERPTGERYTVDAGKDGVTVVPVFFYAGSAGSLRDDLLTKEPPVETMVIQKGLGEIYSNMQNSKHSKVKHALIADPAQVDAARRIMKDDSFNETPVFAVRMKDGGGFLTMKNADETHSLPFFIESQRAFAALNLMVNQNEDFKGQLAIAAIPLKTAVNDMLDGRLETRTVLFIPPQ